ncbi:reverse transcriptase domain-containing protein [Klebsiella aerogenes]|uniref:reverse transcriptase domain-containing protein n=1 Tax=Klebsiella aerogenes TaxID=548 RepID=UPI002FF53E96
MNRLRTLPDRATEGAYARMMQAWQWLCEQRTDAPDHADIWDIRYQQANNPAWLRELTDQVLRGDWRLSPLSLHGQQDNRKAVWGAQDALVLKWTALSLQPLLPLHRACEHVKGHGGGKQSVATLHDLLTQPERDRHAAWRDDTYHGDGEKKTAASAGADVGYHCPENRPDTRGYRWVCRTDIRGYYRNIRKETLLKQVSQHVDSPVLLDLVRQYVHYTVEDGGVFHTPEKGISRGCPLSPLMGALHLYEMDEHFAKQKHIHYARYMDVIIILAKSRWSLRRHTKRLMQWFSEYGFEAHPDKTQIGRTEKGFDWMGAWLTHEGVTDIAPRAKANHREKVRRLYERLARVPLWRRKRARQQVHASESGYRKRWTIWAGALLAVSSCAHASVDLPLGTPYTNTPIGAVISQKRIETRVTDDYHTGGRNRVYVGIGAINEDVHVSFDGSTGREIMLWYTEGCGMGYGIDPASVSIDTPDGTHIPVQVAAGVLGLTEPEKHVIPRGSIVTMTVQLVKYKTVPTGSTCNPAGGGQVFTIGLYGASRAVGGQRIGARPVFGATTPVTVPGVTKTGGARTCSLMYDSGGSVSSWDIDLGEVQRTDAREQVVAAGQARSVRLTCTGGVAGSSTYVSVVWANGGGGGFGYPSDGDHGFKAGLSTTYVGVGNGCPGPAGLMSDSNYLVFPADGGTTVLYPILCSTGVPKVRTGPDSISGTIRQVDQ